MRDAASIVSIAVGTLTIVSTLGRFLIYKPIVRLIEERTHPVQPSANGGLSLADVARSANRIEKRLVSLERQLDRHLEFHLTDGKK